MTDFVKRKLTRGDCLKEPRPCTRHCPYRLDGAESCALDVADRGGTTQEEVAALIGVSWSRAQQIETEALRKLCKALGRPMPARADYSPPIQAKPRRDLDSLMDLVVQAVSEQGTATVASIADAIGVKRDAVREPLGALLDDERLVRVRRNTIQDAYLYALPESEAAE